MLDKDAAPVPNKFRPSDYSAALVQYLLREKARVTGTRVLDVGCGSGVLLAAAGAAGAADLTGVDIEPEAVSATQSLLDQQGYARRRDIHLGELFAPVSNRQFDLILANLPHFPMNHSAVDGRLASWSEGGADGRRVLDRFLAELMPHLAPGGRALVTHNTFIGLDVTYSTAAQLGLDVRVIDSFLVPLPKAKLAAMTPDVLARETGKSIHRFGEFAFGEVSLLCITESRPAGDPG